MDAFNEIRLYVKYGQLGYKALHKHTKINND
ncbi:hypothetical protein [Brachyspira hyodysenteriae]